MFKTKGKLPSLASTCAQSHPGLRRWRARRGFTLVEVIVATVILAIGLLGALTAFSMASRVSRVSHNDTIITMLAQEKLAEIRLLGPTGLSSAETSGDFGSDYPGYGWRIIVGAPDELNVITVDLVIYAPELTHTREVWFSTNVFD